MNANYPLHFFSFESANLTLLKFPINPKKIEENSQLFLHKYLSPKKCIFDYNPLRLKDRFIKIFMIISDI